MIVGIFLSPIAPNDQHHIYILCRPVCGMFIFSVKTPKDTPCVFPTDNKCSRRLCSQSQGVYHCCSNVKCPWKICFVRVCGHRCILGEMYVFPVLVRLRDVLFFKNPLHTVYLLQVSLVTSKMTKLCRVFSREKNFTQTQRGNAECFHKTSQNFWKKSFCVLDVSG